VKIAVAHKPRFAPGTKYEYSNTGYVVLGLIVEAATKHTLAQELRTRVFEPLHLRGTTFGVGPASAGRNAHGYVSLNGALLDVTPLNLSFEYAAGAIVSTPDDIARFYRALVTGKLLHAAELRAMKTPAAPADGYGFGLGKIRLPCGIAYGHTGATPGFYTHAEASGDGHREVILFYNRDVDDFSAAAKQADEKLLLSAFCG
jgi:D-alanyl-D-alanine carboxypeptidase